MCLKRTGRGGVCTQQSTSFSQNGMSCQASTAPIHRESTSCQLTTTISSFSPHTHLISRIFILSSLSMALATTSQARSPFDDALLDYKKRTGHDVLSSDAASAVGIADIDNPSGIHAVFKTMLADVRRSQDKSSTLDSALGKVLDVMLRFTEVAGEVAAASVRYPSFVRCSILILCSASPRRERNLCRVRDSNQGARRRLVKRRYLTSCVDDKELQRPEGRAGGASHQGLRLPGALRCPREPRHLEYTEPRVVYADIHQRPERFRVGHEDSQGKG